MIVPKKGDYIKILFSSGMVDDGFVDFWAEDDDRGITWSQISLSTNRNFKMLIQNYWVAAYSVSEPIDQEEQFVEDETKVVDDVSDVVQQHKKIVEPEEPIEAKGVLNHTDRAKVIAEGRKERAREINKQINDLMEREDISAEFSLKKQMEKYVLPSFKKRSQK